MGITIVHHLLAAKPPHGIFQPVPAKSLDVSGHLKRLAGETWWNHDWKAQTTAKFSKKGLKPISNSRRSSAFDTGLNGRSGVRPSNDLEAGWLVGGDMLLPFWIVHGKKRGAFFMWIRWLYQINYQNWTLLGWWWIAHWMTNHNTWVSFQTWYLVLFKHPKTKLPKCIRTVRLLGLGCFIKPPIKRLFATGALT